MSTPAGQGNMASPNPALRADASKVVFPPVLKNENPSTHVLRYMDGLTKKSMKMIDTCQKYSIDRIVQTVPGYDLTNRIFMINYIWDCYRDHVKIHK
jgi:hypothetical protein